MTASFALSFALAPVLYGLASILYFAELRSSQARLGKMATWSLVAGCLVHVAGFIALGLERGVFPPVSSGESLSALALSTAVLFLVTDQGKVGSGLAFVASALVTLFAIGSAFFGVGESLSPVLRDVWFAPHAFFVIVAFASFALAALLSAAYMIQYRQLRQHQPSGLSSVLPPLQVLDRGASRATVIGFVLLTVGLLLGMFLADHVWGRPWSWDPKQCMTLLTWLLYGAGLVLRRLREWQGGRVAAVNLTAFSSVLLGLVIVIALFDSAHRFG